jgi:peptidyl-prolyl cis-trans isomerase SurA
LAFLITFPSSARSETIDRIIARINNQIITLSDLQEITDALLAASEPELTGAEREAKRSEVEKDVLENMIEEKLIIDFAQARGITVEEKELEKAIEELKKRHSLNDFQFQQVLEQQETTLEDYKGRIKNQILVSRAMNFMVHSRVDLNEADAKGYYESHKEEFYLPEDIKVRQILIVCPPNVDPAERERAKAEAGYVHKALLNGGDFSQLAKKHSQDPSADKGGDIGYTKKGELLPVLEKVLFGMEKDAISALIETKHGFHILKVEEKRTQRLKPFTDVKEDILNKIYKEKIDTMHEQWIDEIRKDAFVENLY